MRLDTFDKLPSGMEDYLSANGWHFNKKMCDWAVKKMRKTNSEKIVAMDKTFVDNLLTRCNIILDNDYGYDAVYVANMAKTDFWGNALIDETRLAYYVKDYIDDPDGYEGLPFTRFYADCIGSGTPINWEDLI